MKDVRAPERGLVSVVIAGFNCERFIEPTLRSALDQTYPSKEVVFVDDGSTDGTRSAVERLAPSVRYLPVPHGGVSAARNAGIAATSGQHVALLDHDDLWAPDKIERQVALMEAHPDLGLVFTRAKVVGDPSHPSILPPPGRVWEPRFKERVASGDPAQVYAELVLENFIPYSSILARRVALPIPGPFKAHLRYAEDWDFVLRMAEVKRFAFIPETLTTYTIRPGRATERMADLRLEEIAVLEDNVARNPWLLTRDAAAVKRRRATLLKEAGYWLLRERRGGEARPLLRRAWRMRPFDVKLPAYLIASLAAAPRPSPGTHRPGRG